MWNGWTCSLCEGILSPFWSGSSAVQMLQGAFILLFEEHSILLQRCRELNRCLCDKSRMVTNVKTCLWCWMLHWLDCKGGELWLILQIKIMNHPWSGLTGYGHSPFLAGVFEEEPVNEKSVWPFWLQPDLATFVLWGFSSPVMPWMLPSPEKHHISCEWLTSTIQYASWLFQKTGGLYLLDSLKLLSYITSNQSNKVAGILGKSLLWNGEETLLQGSFSQYPQKCSVERCCHKPSHAAVPLLAARRGKAISKRATGYSLLPEDESLWDQQPSETQRWLPALEDLWEHFYHNGLYTVRRTLPSVLEEPWGWPSEGGALQGSSQPEEHQKHYCYCLELLQEGMVWFSSLGFVPAAQNATVRFCKASNLISVKVVLMCIQAVHTLLKSTSLKCFLVMVYILLRMNHRGFVVWGFFPP